MTDITPVAGETPSVGASITARVKGDDDATGTLPVVFEHRYFTLMRGEDGGDYLASPSNVLVLACPKPNQVILVEDGPGRSAGWCSSRPVARSNPAKILWTQPSGSFGREVGLAARQLTLFAVLDHDAKYSTRRTAIVYATELYSAALPGDERHPIGVQTVGIDMLACLITNGAVTDA